MNGYELILERLEARRRPVTLTRRDFLKVGVAATGGLLIGSLVPHSGQARAEAPVELNPYVQIDPDGTVRIYVPKSEMGQGVRTSLALLVAEELDADWEQVRVEQAPLDPRYGNQGTGGSSSVRTRWQELREAGAMARVLLVEAAARRWGVDPARCRTKKGQVLHPNGRDVLAYGELAAEAARLEPPATVSLKDPAAFQLIGRPHIGVDVPEIITGRATYGIDMHVPGMLVASVVRCPYITGRLRSYDDTAARQVPGVRTVVEVPAIGADVHVRPGVAVVAEHTWAALKGRQALRVEWEPGEAAAHSSAAYLEQMQALAARPGQVIRERGVVEKALDQGARRVDATYAVPFLAHAPMEPMNATAHVEGNRCTIWAPVQIPAWVARATAQALGIPERNVRVFITLLGGGFGRRLNPDYAVEAALISKAVGAPVQVVWTREDDLQFDFYRPMAVHRIRAALDERGQPLAWYHRVVSTSIRATLQGPEAPDQHRSEVGGADLLPYRVPNWRLEYHPFQSPLPRGWWRSVDHTHTAFAVESFIDEMAAAAGRDPLAYRLELFDMEARTDGPYGYDPARLRRVLELAAEKAGWGQPLPEGHGRGIACHWSFRSYVAEVVEASVDDEGQVHVHRVVAAIDCGRIINPNGAEAQAVGGILDGLWTALKAEATLEGGRITITNFDTYPLLRQREVPPTIEVYFVESDQEPTGLGEPPVPPVAPALANAIYAATGRRLRQLPIRAEMLRS
ncbi:xanthine dehydrogenase family protein molybdopterin-binding subunit [Rhodothermus profundi]|uniref:Isoquinoline 1-oxidoreductase, beta subunit n=1 Tax=Rhodothermus profundi TaxID=633813 RepID=A0A1M6Q741_9BACT|nr:xanthine dehydrogenase family protein molybdopterin-binding subunit [Rhodothermus profundi]SHK16072.1 isoquinoline 1-oxidoreductase, beta subunit [Rhodothermus profundi]